MPNSGMSNFEPRLLLSKLFCRRITTSATHLGPAVQNLTKLLAKVMLEFLYLEIWKYIDIFDCKNVNVFENSYNS